MMERSIGRYSVRGLLKSNCFLKAFLQSPRQKQRVRKWKSGSLDMDPQKATRIGWYLVVIAFLPLANMHERLMKINWKPLILIEINYPQASTRGLCRSEVLWLAGSFFPAASNEPTNECSSLTCQKQCQAKSTKPTQRAKNKKLAADGEEFYDVDGTSSTASMAPSAHVFTIVIIFFLLIILTLILLVSWLLWKSHKRFGSWHEVMRTFRSSQPQTQVSF